MRRETEAADATLDVAENDRRGVLLSVLAETAQDYIQLRGVQSTRAVTEEPCGNALEFKAFRDIGQLFAT